MNKTLYRGSLLWGLTAIASCSAPVANIPAEAVKTEATSTSNPELAAFIEYYLANARTLVPMVGYVALPSEAYRLALKHFQNRKVGSVFDGTSQPNLTIEELLQKEAKF
ncbi:hypothetical protein [Almyronema epifaneia]|uniref:Uncharacterized protein n=1 Tax=Almyronema epifaneia S1 TaxID=2991925 RepID=A0ABW6IE26_9CYAN